MSSLPSAVVTPPGDSPHNSTTASASGGSGVLSGKTAVVAETPAQVLTPGMTYRIFATSSGPSPTPERSNFTAAGELSGGCDAELVDNQGTVLQRAVPSKTRLGEFELTVPPDLIPGSGCFLRSSQVLRVTPMGVEQKLMGA